MECLVFFPCKKFEEGNGFGRVYLDPVEEKYLFNNNKATGVSYLISFNDLDKAYEVWKQIADSILKKGYCLGTYAEEPQLE